jgi:protein kinase A
MNRGHNGAADHWSLGVLIYELIAGKTPFYEEGMDQLELFKANVRGRYTMPRGISPEGASLIKGLIVKDPTQRLGSLKGGEDDILNHPWFASIDIDKLRSKEIKAPYVPKIKNPLDASNFDDWSHLEDKTKKKYPKLTAEQERTFASF